jgi:prolyl 4-hydroxylase
MSETETVVAPTTSTAIPAQAISPDLRLWILNQTQAGVPLHTLLQNMLAAGWQEAVALDALETTLEAHLGEDGVQKAWAVPSVVHANQKNVLTLHDRRVRVLMTVHRPAIVVLDGFLSDDECQGLIDAARPRMLRSLTVDPATGGSELHDSRTSDGMFFNVGESELVQRIERRIEHLVQWPLSRGEGMQVLRYGVGAEYKPHHDYFDPAAPGTPSILKRGGQRVGTVVMYLNDVAAGGGTSFPELGLTVAAQRGNAVFFGYPIPHISTKTLHGGAPVLDGEKWVATKWLRQGDFQ